MEEIMHDAGDYYTSHWTTEKLIRLTENDDLGTVLKIEIKIDSRQTEMSGLGYLLPNLRQLKLNNGYVPILRDLGTGYKNLVHLFMARCHVSDLDGIGSISTLREVYLAFNQINDISDLARLEELEILDLEGNLIDDFDQLEYLSLCSNLTSLTVTGNPLYSKENARDSVLKILPNLKSLDDTSTIDVPAEVAIPSRPASARPSSQTGRKLAAPPTSTPNPRPISSRYSRRCVTPAGTSRDANGNINPTPPILPPLFQKKSTILPSITAPVQPLPPTTDRTIVTNFRKRVLKQDIMPRLPSPSDRPIVMLAARRRSFNLGALTLDPIILKDPILNS